MEAIEIRTEDGASLHGLRWDATPPVKAMVQISHGAAEHLRRYDRLARKLSASGYAVIGADHRGHGANAYLHGLGNFGPAGFEGVVTDLVAVGDEARRHFGDLPLFLIGHSMGSFAAQAFLLRWPDRLDALVLSGTAAFDRFAADGDTSRGMAMLNDAFQPARTPFDWLSRDEREVDAYVTDPLCGFDLSAEAQISIAQTVFGATRDPRLQAARRDMPIYIMSGECDPVVGPAQVYSRAVAEDYRSAGFADVTHRIYPGARHELFNEIDRDQVAADLIAWLDNRFAPRRGAD